jgi:Protein of unknown function (DUF4231)
MPAISDASNQAAKGPVAQLLVYTEQILDIESQLRQAKLLRTLLRLSQSGIFIGVFALYVFNVVTWRDHKLKDLTDWPVSILLVFMAAYIAGYYLYKYTANPHGEQDGIIQLRDVRKLELELELARERKRLHAASINLDMTTRQLVYRDGVSVEIEKYRRESKHYRRIHNSLQAIIIIGALAGSTLTSLLQSVPALRWYAVATTFAVGVAAGFTGYFKFRERSFYLQQTSDAIDQELSAVGLGIGRYKEKEEEDALTEFTEQVELLKAEQRKRQQQLEQPSEGREGTQ